MNETILGVLTPKQQAILDFIREQIVECGYPPAIREICKKFGFVSPNGVMCHLKALEKKGYITRVGNHARAIRLTMDDPVSESSGMPFLGAVAAGPPIEAIQQAERLNVHEMFNGKGHYILQVRGQSMIDDHINDGDYVVIKPEQNPKNGARVVALIDGEATLKKYTREQDHVVLTPMNDTMKPIIIEDDKQIEILGVLVGVARMCI